MSSYSLSKNLLFIHPPKTAGTSIRAVLGGFIEDMNDVEAVDAADRKATGRERDAAYSNHMPLWAIEELFARTGGPDVAAMRKVMVVRNPWARMVSLYFHRRRKAHLTVEGKPRNRPEDIAVIERGFGAWLMETQHPGDSVLTRMPLASWGRNRAGNYAITVPLRFERLAEDWEEFCGVIGIGRVDLPQILIGNGEADRYRDFYDADTKAHIERHFAEDIERFGYEF